MKKTRLLNVVLAMSVLIILVVALCIKREDFRQGPDGFDSWAHELSAKEGTYNPGKIIVEGMDQESVSALADRMGAQVRTIIDGETAILVLPETLSISDIANDESYAAYMEYMHADFYVQPCAVSSDNSKAYDVRGDINLQKTWDVTTGEGITVAIIDTGIDTDCPSFAGRISDKSFNASTGQVVSDYDMSVIEDTDGHGTAVACAVAADPAADENLIGVAPGVTILVIKCELTDGVFTTSDLIAGIAYAIEQDADVINMSFFVGAETNPFKRMTGLAVDSDCICVAAAGDYATSAVGWPAADENVIGVGAVSRDTDFLTAAVGFGSDGVTDSPLELTKASNYGFNSELTAPAKVTAYKPDGQIKNFSGTSFASARVSGAIALFLSQNRDQEFGGVVEMLRASGKDMGMPGLDWYYGCGLLDVDALVVEEKGTITYDYLTDEIENRTQPFVRGHKVQYLDEPERLYSVFDGWYTDIHCTDEFSWQASTLRQNITLYASWANEDDTIPYSYIVQEDGTASITGYLGKRRFVSVPGTIDGYLVTAVGENAFLGNTRVREVALPDTLLQIGKHAFDGCSRLNVVTIPRSVQVIDEYAFADCSSLYEVAIPADGALREIGDFAFAQCGMLTRFDVPDNLELVSGAAFYADMGIRRITVSPSCRNYSIRENALCRAVGAGTQLVYYPAGLAVPYTIPTDITSLGRYAFNYSIAGSIACPGGLTEMGDNCFVNSQITEMTLLGTLDKIPEGGFARCQKLRYISLPDSIEIIDAEAFFYCAALERVQIANSRIQTIGGSAFALCGQLEDMSFIGEQVTKIGIGAFRDCGIREIYLPASLEEIKESAFANCRNALTLRFAEDFAVSEFPEGVFSGCSSITEVELPAQLAKIGTDCFTDTGLRLIRVPVGLEEIGCGAFKECRYLERIEVADGNPVYFARDGVLYERDEETGEITLHTYPGGAASSFSVPSDVSHIGKFAFYGNIDLTDVTLPAGLLTIDQSAFSFCDFLRTVTFGDGLRELGVQAFFWCYQLTDVELPDSVETIQNGAFCGCLGLHEFTLPAGLVSLGSGVFENCYNLTSIVFPEETTISRLGYGAFAKCGITSVTIPATVQSMGQSVFEGCDQLKTVRFAENSRLTAIAAWTFEGADRLETVYFGDGNALQHIEARAFENLTNLRSVNLEACTNLKIINNYAFEFCRNLGNVTLPTSLEHIGRYAFFGCAAMDEISIPEKVNYIGRYAFSGTNRIRIYFSAPTLPETLQENWDYGIGGYYLGTSASQTEGDWTYTVLPDGSACVVSYNGAETEITLQTIAGHPVSAIGGGAFEDNTTLRSIILPDTLTTICDRAFRGTTALEAMEIPANVTFIGTEAFAGSGLASAVFQTGSQLKAISNSGFANTANLRTITIPASVTEIKARAFYRSGLETVIFQEGSQLDQIGRYAFAGSALKTVSLPDSLAKVDYYAFAETEQLESVLFGGGTVQIYGRAFYASGLRQVDVPANVEYLGECCFVDCSNLTAITVAEDNPYYSSDQGILFNKAGTKLITCPAGKTGSYTVPSNVSVLGFSAFEESKLSSVTIPADSSLVTIGYRAFFNCHSLNSIRIPSGILSIDFYAFAYCENLKTVTVEPGSSLAGIYEGAFFNCKSLTEMTIPAGVREISDKAFSGCESLTQVTFEEGSTLAFIGDEAFAYTGILTPSFPDTLREVGAYAFAHSKITTAVLPDSVREIGDYAFAYSNIAVLELPDDIQGVGDKLLMGCTAVTRLKVPTVHGGDGLDPGISYYFGAGDGTVQQAHGKDLIPETLEDVTITQMTTVPAGAFCGMQNLKSVTFSKTIHSVEGGAFYGCTSLETIPQLDHVTTVGDSAFYECSSISDFGSMAAVQSIGERAFSECDLLTEAALDSLEEIGEGAFRCCKLTSVRIPGSCRTISPSAFEYNLDLHEVILDEGVERIENDAFSGCPIQSFEIPSTLTYIGDRVIYGSMDIPLLVIPETVEHLGEEAIYAKQIELHCMDAEVSKGALISNCVFVTGDTDGAAWDPDWAEHVDSCYYGCSGQRESAEGLLYRTSQDGALILGYTGTAAELHLDSVDGVPIHVVCREAFAGNEAVTAVEIGESVSHLESCAFYECPNLEEVTVRGELGASVFANCPKLSRAVLDGVKELSVCLFSNCPALTEVPGMEDVEIIGSCAFENDAALEEITFGDRLERIDSYAFAYTGLKEADIPDSVTSLGHHAFSGCHALQNMTVGNGVTEIKDYSFYGTGIKTVSLSENVSVIGEHAFSSCWNLEMVSIPGAVTIGNWAFKGSGALKEVGIGHNLESIGIDAFRACAISGDLHLPATLMTIGRTAFYENPSVYLLFEGDALPENLEEDWDKGIEGYTLGASFSELVDPETGLLYCTSDGCAMVSGWNGSAAEVTIDTVGDGIPVTAIMTEALAGSPVQQVTLGPSIREIRKGAFKNCAELRTVSFAENSALLEIGNEAFSGSGLEEIELPLAVSRVGASTFAGCTALRKVMLPDSLISLGDQAFEGCSQLESCTQPTQIRHLGKWIFNGCPKLIETRNGAKYAGTWLCEVPNGNLPSRFVVEDGTTAICGSAFGYCPKIEELVIPEGVTCIGSRAFTGCINMTSIQLPSTLRTIGTNAFAGAAKLETVVVPDAVEEIGESAFCSMRSLQSITLPFIGGSAEDSNDIWYLLSRYDKSNSYQERSTPKNITITGSVDHIYGLGIQHYKVELESITFTDPCADGCVIDDAAFWGLTNLQHLVLPKTVTSIGDSAFLGCGLTHLDLPDTLTSIGASAFEGCALTEIKIPDAVKTIGASAFANCSGLTKIELPAGLTNLGDLAFDGCTALTSMTIPDSVEHIGKTILRGCTGVTEVTTPFIGETLEQPCHIRDWFDKWDSNLMVKRVTITGPLTELVNTLAYSPHVEEVRLPDSIERLSGTFTGCTNLRVVNIPQGLKEIGMDTFSGCTSLPCIDIPAGVESIDHSAFKDVKMLILRCGVCYPASNYNVETLAINYQGVLPYIPTKNLVLLNGSTQVTRSSFESLTDITIFCHQAESTVAWPDGWNNGNPVYYDGTWKSISFWKDGAVIKTSLQQSGEVVLLPAASLSRKAADQNAEYTLVGWDINADGRTDRILSTTLSGEIRADAIYNRVPKTAIGCTAVGMNAISQTDEAVILDAVTNHTDLVRTEVTFGADVLDKSRGVEVISDLGRVSFDKDAVGVIADQSAATVKMMMEEVPADLLSATDENSKPIILTLSGENGPISFSGGGLGTAAVTMDCPGYTAEHRAYVYSVSEGGVWSPVDSAFHAEDGTITFTADRSTLYVVSPVKPNCTEHSYRSEVVLPTCVEEGYTLHTCRYCGESYADNYVPATGHSYGEPVWTWTEDYSAAAAAFTCSCGHVETVAAAITAETTEPTHTEDGVTVYTATVTFEGTVYTDTREVMIPATGHSYGEPEWNWTEDYSAATAAFTCSCGHVETLTADITAETTEPTHTEDGVTVYTATVTFEGTVYTDTREVMIPATGHSYGEPVWTWTEDYSAATAAFTCSCGHVETVAAAITAETTAPTHTEDGVTVYTATVTFEGTVYTDTRSAVVILPLTIIDQPDHQSGMVGETVSFSVTADGTGLTYQWEYRTSTGDWTASTMIGAQTDTINVPVKASRNQYQYRCVITDIHGETLTSDAATLTVKTNITTQPASAKLTVGETAKFTVSATGAGLRYQWQYKTATGTSWSSCTLTGCKSVTMSVPVTAARNGYQYRCKITDANGAVIYSYVAKLTVKTKITAQPTAQSGYVGDTAKFTVTAAGAGLRYQWQYKTATGTSWSSSTLTGCKSVTMSVPVTAARNGYQYRCKITDANGAVTYSSAAKLTVKTKITAQPNSVSTTAGDTAKFTVTAAGAGLTYQWQYRTSSGGTWKNCGLTGSKTKALSVSATIARNGYQYRCVITDANGTETYSSAATLTVK